ncbi:immunoglobulin-like domain-containing protein [Listeria sp. ILCC797]|uniref:immunoglobulin-like domain-containing protein n=1 Tax=Listeria sp. ILCC797 TaxID=1918333 RepID=UPI000B5890AD|nr:immunoglobulin-like domain-containing protein [Listeria sp. ILCC797]
MKKILSSLVVAMLVLLTLSNALLPVTAKAETGVTLEVSTEKELRDALNNDLVSKVILQNDLVLNDYTNYVIKHDVTIEGANHKVTLNNSSFASDLSSAASVIFSNINFSSNSQTIFKTSVVNYAVTLENVTLNGGAAISNTNGVTYIKGNNTFTTSGTTDVFNVKNLIFDSTSTTTIKNTGDANAVQVYSSGNVQLGAGAKLSIDTMGIGIYLNGPQQTFTVGDSSELDVVSRYASIKGVEATVNIGASSKVKLNYQKAVMSSDSRIYVNQLTMTKSTSFEAISAPISLYAVQISPAGKLTMDSVAYFDFRNENSTGLALYMEGNGGVFSTTNQNIAAWEKGTDILGTPKYTWRNLTSITDLYGNVSNVSITNVPAYKTEFKNQNFERLSNGSITNDKPVINANDQTLKVGDTFDPIAGVTATDTEDGDLTSAIEVTANNVDTTKAGTYQVTYKVTDSDGNETTKTITVTVGTNDKPVINAADKTLKVGDAFDPKTGVTATDTEDGDLTSAIEVTANDVDTAKTGTYHVSYKVTDSDGNEATKTITVTVATNDIPVITAADKTLKVGDAFDPKTGVTASDTEDGDLTSAIEITANNVDTTKAGTYQVTYKVTDSDGNEATKTITVTVTTNDIPVITAADKTLKVGDAFDPKTGVTASDTEDGDLTSAIEVAANNVDTTKAGTYQVTYKVTDSDGNEATKTITVTVEKVTEGTILANDYTIGTSNYVEGTYTGDVAKIKLIVNGEEKQTIAVTGNAYRYYANDKIASVDDEVYAVALDADGKELDRVKVNILKPTEGTITAKDYTIGTSNYVEGTYTGDVAKVKLIVNGEEKQTITVTGNAYRYYAKDKILNAGDEVYAVALDASGKELDRTKVNIKEPTSGTITAKDYLLGTNSYVEGTYTGDVAKIKLIVNSEEKQAITVTGNTYKYYAKNLITSVTDVVYVVALDANGKELDRALVNVREEATAGEITAKDFVKGTENYVSGTYTGDITKISITVNGQEYTRIPVSGGTFNYYANDKILKVSDQVIVKGYDDKGNLLDSKAITVKSAADTTGEILLDSYKLGSETYITGTYTGDIVKIRVTKGDQTYSTIPAIGGVLKYYAKNIVTSATDVVMVEGLNSEGKVVSTKQLNIYTTDGTITANSFQLGTDIRVTGTYTGDVKRVALEVNGVVQKAIPVADNKYEYYAKNLITSSNDTVYAIAYDSLGKELNRVPVSVADKPPVTGSIALEEFKVGKDKYVEGTYTGDVSRVELVVNGVVQSRIPATGNVIKYYAATLINSVDDEVKMIGYAADGTQVAEVDLVLGEVTGTITANSYKITGDYLEGTYTGEVTRVSVEVNGTELQTIPVAADNTYKYYLKGKVTSLTDEVKVYGKDDLGNILSEDDVQLTE